MIKLILADDHQLIREGLKKILRSEPDMKIVAEAGNSAELFSQLRLISADVAILDVNMPGRSGIDILADLKKEFPTLRVLMLSMHPEDSLAVRSLKAGALGYVTKHAPPDELMKAIRRVAKGRKYVSETLAEKLADDVRQTGTSLPHELLSEREFEVFQLLGTGKTVTEVAVLLSLSIPTISTYRARILEKMKMNSTAEIIYYAVRHKLVE